MIFGRYLFLAIIMGIAFTTDYKASRIPNNLVLAGIAGGLFINLFNGMEGLLFALKGMAFGFGVLLVIYMLGGVGAGDVKLFAALGAISGVNFTLSTLVYSLFAAAVIGIIMVALKGELGLRMKKLFYTVVAVVTLGRIKIISNLKESQGFRFPFMYAVLPGLLLAYFMPVII